MHASAASWECLEQGSNGIKANSRLSGVMGERSRITEDYSKSKSSQNMKQNGFIVNLFRKNDVQYLGTLSVNVFCFLAEFFFNIKMKPM
jgi:hypothetical protein